MDLIRVNAEQKDIETIKAYSIDLEYGDEGNDFELTLDIKDGVFQEDEFFYIEGTEYGGIIDEIDVLTKDKSMVYRGRTWQGIFENCIIKPPVGASYYIVEGDANEILALLIEYLGLADLFVASEKTAATLTPNGFRYVEAYSGISAYFKKNGLKLKFNCIGVGEKTMVQIAAIPLVDYSIDDEWDSSQVNLDISQIQNQTNHLICLGSGNLAERHIIHLFCDQTGNIQPVAVTDVPYKDSDYILDESQRVITGLDEITKVYDYPNVENVVNYELLATKPSDWAVQSRFFALNEDTFEQLSNINVTKFAKLSQVPEDWITNYTDYYQISDGTYQNIPEQSQYNYELQSAKPSDWTNNYGNYYYYESDGTSYSYEKVKGIATPYYEVQTMVPSDWENNYSNYYYLDGTSYKQCALITNTEYRRIPEISSLKQSYKGLYVVPAMTYRYDSIKLTDWDEREAYIDVEQFLEWVHFAEKLGEGLFGYSPRSKSYINVNQLITEALTSVGNHIYASTLARDFGITLYTVQTTLENDNSQYKVFNAIKYSDVLRLFYKYEESHAPYWRPNTYYTKKSKKVAPTWQANTYYTLTITHNPPTFTIGKYYRMYAELVPNEFVANTYYRQHVDHYYNLIEAGKKKFNELRKANESIEADLDASREYDVGDIVGANDITTGTKVRVPIQGKIVKGNDARLTITYRLGGQL